jgi:hypothetical protein
MICYPDDDLVSGLQAEQRLSAGTMPQCWKRSTGMPKRSIGAHERARRADRTDYRANRRRSHERRSESSISTDTTRTRFPTLPRTYDRIFES